MATGRMAFTANTTAMYFDAILNRAPVSPITLNPGMPPKFEEVINRLLEKDRKLRYQSATDLEADLRRIKRDMESRSDGAAFSIATPAVPRRSVRRWAFPAVVIAVLALGAIGAFVFNRDSSSEPASVKFTPVTNSGHIALAAALCGWRLIASARFQEVAKSTENTTRFIAETLDFRTEQARKLLIRR